MLTVNKESLKKYALKYLARYASSKKNLIIVLNRKLDRSINKEKKEYELYKNDIINIVNDLEKNNIINDESFANSKAYSYINTGKSIRSIKYNLIKKGIEKHHINNALKRLEETMPNLEMESAINFARKKKLGRFGNLDKKEKDLSKMSRAGFSYGVSLEALGYE